MEKSQLFITAIVAMIIFLGVVLAFAVADAGPAKDESWSRAAGDGGMHLSNFYVGDDDVVYLAEGKTIRAIDQDGSEKWSLMPPDPEHISEYGTNWNLLAAATRDGVVYLVIQPSEGQVPFYRGELLAVSAEGKPLWNHLLNFTVADLLSDSRLNVTEDRLYLYNDGKYSVYDLDGRLLWAITDIDYPPSIDENGYIYTAIGPYGARNEFPSNLKAYYPNGTVYWSHYTSDYNLTSLAGSPVRMPMYSNGILYVWLLDGVAALDRNGSLLWAKEYPESLFDVDLYYIDGDSPFDEAGNIYLLERIYYGGNEASAAGDKARTLKERKVHVLTPEGVEKTFYLPADFQLSPATSIRDGIAYSARAVPGPEGNLSEVDQYRLIAYDVLTGREVWNYTANASPKQTVLENESTVSAILSYPDAWVVLEDNKLSPEAWYKKHKIRYGRSVICSGSSGGVLAGQHNIYLNYMAYNFEYPAFLGKSNCTYAGGIYALDREGKLVWSRQTDSYVTSTVEKNGTVYYRTNDGKFFAAGSGLAAGALSAAAYIILRLFGLGTVSRARSRLDQNENRSAIVKLIDSCPGLTLHDIARLSGVNIGTVRYHLLVLTLNHRITTFDDGDKYVRYFRNSKTYSEDEMLIISLARREQIRRMMAFIVDNSSMPNQEIAKRLDIPESAVSKQMRILAARDIVVKNAVAGERQSYQINSRFLPIIRSHVTRAGPYQE